MTRLPLVSPLLWFGLLAAPAAWVVQLVVGYWLEDADCSAAGRRWELSGTTGELAVHGVAAAVAVAGAVVAAGLWHTARRGPTDERGRLAFMAQAALLVSGLFLALVVVTAVGANVVDTCVR